MIKQDIAWIDQLPPVRGKIEQHAPLHKLTWFKVGGPADILFTPEDKQDLIDFLKKLPRHIPVMPLGVGSNLLVRDGGINGVVIRFGKKFSSIKIDGTILNVGAGCPDISVASAARDAGIAGLEFLRGVPGTMGGALKMNAGAYGSEIADVFVTAEAVDRAGNLHLLNPEQMGFSYRHTAVPEDYIFVGASLRGRVGQKAGIAARMKEIGAAREESQPLRSRTGGSTFKNPDGDKAWKLVDGAGCRGMRIGGAQVSEKHCNFLINQGGATAHDIENLGEEIRRRVMNNSGINLEWEIQIVGEKAEGTHHG